MTDMLDQVASDVSNAVAALASTHEFAALSDGDKVRTDLAIYTKWFALRMKATEAFESDMALPQALLLVGFTNGPLQFVRMVAYGEEP